MSRALLNKRKDPPMAKKVLLLCGDFSVDFETFLPFLALSVLGDQLDALCRD